MQMCELEEICERGVDDLQRLNKISETRAYAPILEVLDGFAGFAAHTYLLTLLNLVPNLYSLLIFH